MRAIWAVAAGTVVGGALGYAIVRDARAHEALSKAVENVRLPEPDFAMQVPTTAQEFETLQGLVCTCMREHPPQEGRPLDEIADEMTLCVARRLYRSFAWPPVTGDHPTVSELWGTIGVMTRRSLALGDCENVT